MEQNINRCGNYGIFRIKMTKKNHINNIINQAKVNIFNINFIKLY